MTDVWLGVIAVSVAIMALIQLVVLGAIARLALLAIQGVRDLRRDVQPLIEKVNKIAEDVNRVSGIAAAQAERIDHVMASTARRIEDTLNALQDAVKGPVRQGSAIITALKAMFATFWRSSDRSRHGRDDEDPLFVG